MNTNTRIELESELGKRGREFIEAGNAYWQEYQKTLKSSAVVWLEADNGHFILFTRSEYKRDILGSCSFFHDEPELKHPFELTPLTKKINELFEFWDNNSPVHSGAEIVAELRELLK